MSVDSSAPGSDAAEGYFAPDSITRKIHANPVMLVGGLRALLIQALHPLAMAGVAQHSDFRADPAKRLRGTVRYVNTLTYGAKPAARAAAAQVRRIHERVRGVDPVTGRAYSATDPELLTWVHCVEVHSFLAAYRAYGGRLSRAERDRYLAEQVAAAELIGIPRALVPASVAAYRDFFAARLPQLCSSANAAETIAFVRRPSLPGSRWRNLALTPAMRTLGQAATALVPRTLRPMSGLPPRGSRDLPAAAAVILASQALMATRLIPPLGDAVAGQVRRALGIAA
jgi:uncharacterized protein (DUF2236 family)